MTRPKAECRKCGRAEGHYLNCRASPRPDEIIVPAFEPDMDSVCAEDGCEDPVKNTRAKYCAEHSTKPAYAARAYRGRKALQKEKQDVEHG